VFQLICSSYCSEIRNKVHLTLILDCLIRILATCTFIWRVKGKLFQVFFIVYCHGRSNGLHNVYAIVLGGSLGHAALDDKIYPYHAPNSPVISLPSLV